MKTVISKLILRACVAAGAIFGTVLHAGQQIIWWTPSVSASVGAYGFTFATNSGGLAQFTRVVDGRTTSSNTFTVPAGRWYVRATSMTVSNGFSDESNEVVFDIPTPITIRLNLSSAATPEGPWRDETNSPPIEVTLTDPQRFYRSRVDWVR